MARASEKQLLPLLSVLAVVGVWMVILIVLSAEPQENILGLATTSTYDAYTGDQELLSGVKVLTASAADGYLTVTAYPNVPVGWAPNNHYFVHSKAYYSVDGAAWNEVYLNQAGLEGSTSDASTAAPDNWILGPTAVRIPFTETYDQLHIAIYTCREYDAQNPAYSLDVQKALQDNFGERYGYLCGLNDISGSVLDEKNFRLLTLTCNQESCAACSETCDSLGKECGIQTVCGEQISCGTCSVGQACSEGRCVSSCSDTCSSLGFECGTQSVCGSSVNCGSCSSGTCSGGKCVANSFCGDGTVDTGEQCDDGNVFNGDGCSSSCQTESVCSDARSDARVCSDAGIECGSVTDTCGSSRPCGTCSSGTCTNGQCVASCTDNPSCIGRTLGQDFCRVNDGNLLYDYVDECYQNGDCVSVRTIDECNAYQEETCVESSTGATCQSSCTPSCPSPSNVACGSSLGSDGCGGTCLGVGTACSSGECTDNVCSSIVVNSFSVQGCTLPDNTPEGYWDVSCEGRISWDVSGAWGVKVFTDAGVLHASGSSGTTIPTWVNKPGTTIHLYAGCSSDYMSSCEQKLGSKELKATCKSGYTDVTGTWHCLIPCSNPGGACSNGGSCVALGSPYGTVCTEPFACSVAACEPSYGDACINGMCKHELEPAPTASFTVNDKTTVTVDVGTTLHYKWSSSGGTSWSSTWSTSSACGGTGPWDADTAEGSYSWPVDISQAGCSYTISYMVSNSVGTTTKPIYVTVN